ncbi:MAG: bifunctional DNA-formamidopyrimidine glycosylase/DNA-(apurinic or apyrimidinic site) lyase [Candidatus Pelagadaptatus aseana]|uniref:bifunctional DNA-formamidopyrimidine glycosylase/DNA-(apurinic or apyrimidinic site) lyase n=1 Tax=Candidatus Pelagadaptatus aseana TaxID=3120508 RepID=UPI0039B29218
MPELPEVETTRRGIEPYVDGQTIDRAVVRHSGLRWPVPDDLDYCIAGSTVNKLYRRGKYLLFELEQGTVLIHLGMSGSLRVVSGSEPVGKHDHVDLVFTNGAIVRLNDPRRFGAVLWSSGPVAEHKLIAHLGPEPLTDDFNGDYLFQCSRKRTQAIKQFLMDSKVVVGVGNIYANEALFAAGIRPTKAAGKVTRKQYQALAVEVKQVLARAIEQGGTTLKDFVGGDGKPGYFKQELLVYGRGGQPCCRCGRALKEVKLGQRTTVFCSQCQK